jgi:hypothetical protein
MRMQEQFDVAPSIRWMPSSAASSGLIVKYCEAGCLKNFFAEIICAPSPDR